MRPHTNALSIFLLACCMVVATVGAACGPNKRAQTITVALTSVNAARDGFLAWDASHQKALVDSATSREEAEASVAHYYERRKPVTDMLVLVYRALAVAATQNDEYSLSAALGKSAELLTALHELMGN